MVPNRSFSFAVVGKDISYSLSPLIFDWAFQRLGVQGRYDILEMTEESFKALLDRPTEWDGLNVTIPYKTLAYTFCKSVVQSARRVGAVNTIYHTPRAVVGANTDVLGFLYAVKRHYGFLKKAKRMLVIGSGGAARALIWSLRRNFPDSVITVASRDLLRASQMIRQFNPDPNLHFCSLEDGSEDAWSYDVLVNATPVGSKNVKGIPLPVPLHIKPNSLVIDIIYSPQKTEFLTLAEECGAQTENGLVMLITQAAKSFEIWTHIRFPLQQAFRDLLPEFVNA